MPRRPSAAHLMRSLPAATAGLGWASGAATADLARALDPRRLVADRPAADPLELRDP